MITVLTQYVTADEFAARCGVQVRTIHARARNKSIDAIKADGVWFVNAETSPVVEGRMRKYKFGFSKGVCEAYKGNLKNLKRVSTYAKANHSLPNKLYEAVITGKVDAVILGGTPHIDVSNPKLKEFLRREPSHRFFHR